MSFFLTKWSVFIQKKKSSKQTLRIWHMCDCVNDLTGHWIRCRRKNAIRTHKRQANVYKYSQRERERQRWIDEMIVFFGLSSDSITTTTLSTFFLHPILSSTHRNNSHHYRILTLDLAATDGEISRINQPVVNDGIRAQHTPVETDKKSLVRFCAFMTRRGAWKAARTRRRNWFVLR